MRSYLPADHPDKSKEGGSQPTPGAFIDWLVDVVEALDRVLAPHGSICLELGDTYSGAGGENNLYTSGYSGFVQGLDTKKPPGQGIPRGSNGWPADKSLTLIPELFRMTLVYGFNPLTGRQTKRWRLRNVIRWVRPNPPVGALGDKFRSATSELMVFCRTDEAGRKRYFDLDAVREALKEPDANGVPRAGTKLDHDGGNRGTLGDYSASMSAGAPPLDWWNIPLLDGEEETPYGPEPKGYDPAKRRERPVQQTTNHGGSKEARQDFGEAFYNAGNPLGAPPLDWWNIPPGGYQGAHYAVFPEALCVRPIKAMCPEKVCRTCGEPSRRIVEKTEAYAEFREAAKTMRKDPHMEGAGKGQGGLAGSGYNRDPHGVALGSPTAIHRSGEKWRTAGFTECDCTCGEPGCLNGIWNIPESIHYGRPCIYCAKVPGPRWRTGVVLDPFAGSGTTGAVAVGHGRDAVLIDLDERNFDLAMERIGMFLERAQCN